jgi:hypothetical protein
MIDAGLLGISVSGSVVVISPVRAVAAIPYPFSCGERCGFDRAIVIARFSVDAFTEALHNRECQQTHTKRKKKKEETLLVLRPG